MSVVTSISRSITQRLKYPLFLRAATDFREAGPGERVTVGDLSGGVRSFWVARGGSPDIQAVTREHYEPAADEVAFHVYEPSNLVSGLALDWDDPEVRRLARMIGPACAAAVDLAVVERVLCLLRSGTQIRPNDSGLPKEPSVGEAVARIHAAGADPIIIGWADGLPREHRKDAVVLDQYVPRDRLESSDLEALPIDEVFVYAAGGVTAVQWGPFHTKEWDEHGAWVWHVMGKAEIGIVCDTDVWHYEPALRRHGARS